MEDMRVLKHARHYIASMAEGINPLNGEFAPEGDTISQERIQKCCAYVTGLLDKLIQNGGNVGTPHKVNFEISREQIGRVEVSQIPIGINDIAKHINAVTDKNMKGISGAKIASWLVDAGYLTLERYSTPSEKTRKVLNERSHELGITKTSITDKRTGEICDKLLYSENAQRFILSNLDKIAAKEDKHTD